MDNTIELINKLKDIPAMPNVIIKILQMIKDESSSITDLASMISYDQALCIKVLALVNSAYYGFAQQINSLQRALPLLGLQKIKNIVVAVAMRPMFLNQGDKELWEHSIRVAVGCEYLAQKTKIADEDDAFVIGFLHDIGKIVLNMSDHSKYLKVKDFVADGADIIDTERLFFKTSHVQTGALLAKRWQLPVLITNAVKYHHNPEESSIKPPCKLINFVDKILQNNFNIESIDERILTDYKIDIEELSNVISIIRHKADALLLELS